MRPFAEHVLSQIGIGVRNAALHARLCIFAEVGPRCAARQYQMDTNVKRLKLQRQGFGERIHRRLARRVNAEQWQKFWTVEELAREAALSRSTFFERFQNALGMPPMAYLLAWRMALAKKLLRERVEDIAGIAQRVGYGSVSAFSVAFTRYTGRAPGRYSREGNVG